MNGRRILIIIAAAALVLAGGALVYWFLLPDQPIITVTGAWVRATGEMPMSATQAMPGSGGSMDMGGRTTAAYMEIHNSGRVDDKLIKVETDVSKIAQIHKTATQNGVAMMFEVPELPVPAMRTVTLKPMSTHIMLLQLNQALEAGNSIPLILYFEKTGPLKVDAVVKAP